MTSPPVPPQAITARQAATDAVARYEPEATAALIQSPSALLSVLLEASRRALEAAAPHLAAPWAAALARHTHSFTGSHGVELCGGCLREAPCDDMALLEAQP